MVVRYHLFIFCLYINSLYIFRYFLLWTCCIYGDFCVSKRVRHVDCVKLFGHLTYYSTTKSYMHTSKQQSLGPSLVHAKWGEHPYSAARWTRPLGLNTGWLGAGSAHTSGPINNESTANDRTTLNARRCRWNCDRLINVQRKNDTIKTGNFSAASSWRNLCIGNVKNTTLYCSVITVLICTQWQTNSCGWLIELQSYKRNWINMARVGRQISTPPRRTCDLNS